MIKKERIKKALDKYFTLKQALEHCKKRGYPIKKMALYLSSRKYGFIEGTKAPYLFNKEKLNKYIDEVKKKPLAGFETISKVAKELGVSGANIYFWMREGKLKSKRIGVGKGILYVERKTAEVLVSSGRGVVKKNNMEKIGNEKK